MSSRKWSASRLQCAISGPRRWAKAMRTCTTFTTSITFLHLKSNTYSKTISDIHRQELEQHESYLYIKLLVLCKITVGDREIETG